MIGIGEVVVGIVVGGVDIVVVGDVCIFVDVIVVGVVIFCVAFWLVIVKNLVFLIIFCAFGLGLIIFGVGVWYVCIVDVCAHYCVVVIIGFVLILVWVIRLVVVVGIW